MYIILFIANKSACYFQTSQFHVMVCATFIMKKHYFILEKRCSFLLADIGIFIDFLVLEKTKTNMCSVRVCSFYIHGKAHTERCASNKGKVEV